MTVIPMEGARGLWLEVSLAILPMTVIPIELAPVVGGTVFTAPEVRLHEHPIATNESCNQCKLVT